MTTLITIENEKIVKKTLTGSDKLPQGVLVELVVESVLVDRKFIDFYAEKFAEEEK